MQVDGVNDLLDFFHGPQPNLTKGPMRQTRAMRQQMRRLLLGHLIGGTELQKICSQSLKLVALAHHGLHELLEILLDLLFILEGSVGFGLPNALPKDTTATLGLARRTRAGRL